jgi:hypothetical protein
MQRAAAPPRPPRPAARAENVPPARQEGDNAAPAGMSAHYFIQMILHLLLSGNISNERELDVNAICDVIWGVCFIEAYELHFIYLLGWISFSQYMHRFLYRSYDLSFNHILTYVLPMLDYLAEGQPDAAVENQPANDADRAIENENENVPEAAGRGNGGHR